MSNNDIKTTLTTWLLNARRYFIIFMATAPSIVTVASAITAMTPNPTDDGIVAIAHQVLDVLALNIGNNIQTHPEVQ